MSDQRQEFEDTRAEFEEPEVGVEEIEIEWDLGDVDEAAADYAVLLTTVNVY